MTSMQKVALVTGANKGIGFEIVKQLAELGYFVFLGSRNTENGAKAIAELNSKGFKEVETLEIDVTKQNSIQNAVEPVKSKFGRLDILINNAGILGEMPQQASNNTTQNLKIIFETNYFGAVQTTQLFLDLLKQSDAPRIVNISGDLGSFTKNNDPYYPFYKAKLLGYNSSKTALNAFTVTLAYELKDTNFKVNSVNPGFTSTDLNGNTGTQTVDKAGKIIVEFATLSENGPTGKFMSDYGETPW